ncbi:MAG: hypothetical protein HXY18_05135 [Bryobacteraceae bacterium]|nr:hypothetical protein [Bryobacteraceae bacterium]
MFNRGFSEAGYARFLALVRERCGVEVQFRLSETPCFFDWEFMHRLSNDGADLLDQLTTESYLRLSDRAVPAAYRAPNEPQLPLFAVVDFGVVRNERGLLEPRLVEIQAFPSLYAFQPVLAQSYIDAYELPGDLRYLLEGLDMRAYRKLLEESILAGHAPDEVVLLEIDPERQKTRCDFAVTEQMLGVRAVCITRVRKRGIRLYYEINGREVQIKRIYNRVIIDELTARQVQPPFDWRDELDVEWAGHPNWFFRISKFSLPFLKHPSVPPCHFLSELGQLPEDLDRWVLKPLYSFAGRGVTLGPSREQIEAIPGAERDQWLLQQRVEFTPVIETPVGATKAEIRVMYIGGRPVTHIIRMGRGAMMGVDHNKNLAWVGASAALYHGGA